VVRFSIPHSIIIHHQQWLQLVLGRG
jgi:hypothetical protein